MPLRESVARVLADPFNLGATIRPEGEAPLFGAEWILPAKPLALSEAREAVATIEGALIPADWTEFETCMLAMSQNLAIPEAEAMEWTARAKIYRAATDDIPADLLELGAMRCIKTQEFFPRVATWRKAIDPELQQRRRMLERARRCREQSAQPPVAAVAFVRESLEVRLKTMRDSWLNIGRKDRAYKHEIELAALEKRELAAWAIVERDAPSSSAASMSDRQPLPPPSPETRAALDKAAGNWHRAKGHAPLVAKITGTEATAAVLDGLNPPPPTEEPEGDSHAGDTASRAIEW